MIHVIATIQTQSGRRGDVLAEFARIVTVVQNEAGCVYLLAVHRYRNG